MLTLQASITDALVQFAVDVVDKAGLAGIFLLMVAESACIPIPSEATMLFAGFNVSEGHYSLFAVTAVGVLGNLVGSWIAYAVGYYGRIDLLEKHGAKLHIKPSHLRWADDWFQRYGAPTVFFSRMLPIIRTFISLPAGVARMPFWKFTALTLAGCIPWVFLLAFIGQQAGAHWESWKDSLHYVDYAVLAMIAGGIVYLVLRAPPAIACRASRLSSRSPRRSLWACCTVLRSSSRSPRPATSPRCRGCWAGGRRRRPAPRARSSRWRCTPAPRWRCCSSCVTNWSCGSPRVVLPCWRARSRPPRLSAACSSARSRSACGGRAGWRSGWAWALWRSRCATGRAEERGREDAGWVDGLWLGVAQAAALVPGTSRNGMTLAAARARRFRRPDASELSWRVALPVLVGATALKGARVRGAPERAAPLAAGAAAAFASTLASVRWIGLRRERPLWPWAVERAALAAAIVAVSATRPL